MITIAIDIRLIGQNRTGDEAVFRNLTREVLTADTVNRYLLLTDKADSESTDRILTLLGKDGRLPENAEIVVLRARNRYEWNFFSVPLFLSKRSVDVFHTQYILPSFVPRRTKVVTHIHDISFRMFPEYIGVADRLFLSFFIPHTMRRSEMIVVPSAFTRDEIISSYGVSKDRITVIHNAVDPSFLVEPTTEMLALAQSRNGLPESFILSVGTMQPRKNIPTLIGAFAKIRKEFPNLKLVLVGGHGGRHYDTAIDDAIKSEDGLEDSIVFPGYVQQEDMPALYRLASILAFPSRYEGFGIPLLEAFAAGTPVVASDIPPFREVGGEAVTYFDPMDVSACADSLRMLLVDKTAARKAGTAGKIRLESFDWGASAGMMISCYMSVSDRTD